MDFVDARNKLVIEDSPLRRSSDVIYKLCGFLQPWKPLRRGQEHAAIDHDCRSPLVGSSLGAASHRNQIRPLFGL